MRGLWDAVSFLTVLPAGRQTSFDPRRAVPCFPLVGLLLGLLIACVDMLAGRLWPTPVPSLLAVLGLVVCTGALHLDGLGDTADGFYGRRNREEILAIMKDSRLGTMGLVALVGCLAIKWASISVLDADRFLALCLVPAYARGSVLFGLRLLPYARIEAGTARPFFETPPRIPAFTGLCVPCLLSLWLGWAAVSINAAFVVLTAVLVLYYRKKMGGVTGDMLGAMIEIVEAGLFLVLATGGVPC